ncbi:MAG: serine/threonine-protein kinase [Planctomycetota bacterium]
MEFGGYRILELVAQGGMGMVYRAYDLRLHREVALKTLRVRDPVVRQRFRRECEALAQARHPHVMPCYAAGEHEGEPYLVLPLLRGETLAARLVRGPLSLAEAVRIGARLADALAFLHARGILHRDLKPDNVLFDEQGEPLIADFGLVKLESSEQPLERLTLSGAMLGTPQFWPPEQATGQVARIGPASDVYGLGATLYCVLSGRPPQLAETLGELVEALDRPPPPLGSLRPDVPASLARLVHDCLAKDPEARPRAAEVACALGSGRARGARLRRGAAAAPRPGAVRADDPARSRRRGGGGVGPPRRARARPLRRRKDAGGRGPERPPPRAEALADGDWVGSRRARRGAFSVDELVSLREAALRVALRQPSLPRCARRSSSWARCA